MRLDAPTFLGKTSSINLFQLDILIYLFYLTIGHISHCGDKFCANTYKDKLSGLRNFKENDIQRMKEKDMMGYHVTSIDFMKEINLFQGTYVLTNKV